MAQQPTITTESSPSSSTFAGLPETLFKFVPSPNSLIIVAYLIVLALLSSRPKGDKTKSATSYFSDVCNPLDVLKDETDSLMARQMAEVLNKNLASGGATKSEDPFFTQASDQLTKTIVLLTKSILTL